MIFDTSGTVLFWGLDIFGFLQRLNMAEDGAGIACLTPRKTFASKRREHLEERIPFMDMWKRGGRVGTKGPKSKDECFSTLGNIDDRNGIVNENGSQCTALLYKYLSPNLPRNPR